MLMLTQNWKIVLARYRDCGDAKFGIYSRRIGQTKRFSILIIRAAYSDYTNAWKITIRLGKGKMFVFTISLTIQREVKNLIHHLDWMLL